MLDLGELGIRLVVNDNGASNQLSSFGTSADNANTKIFNLKDGLKKLATAFGIGFTIKKVADGLINCTKSAAGFETSFGKVSTLLDSSTTDFDAYKDSIIDASDKTGVAVDELSESIYGSISAGVDSADAVKFTTDAVKLAKGGFTDTAKAVDVMTTAINGYKLNTEDASKVSDMLITTQNLGKTTVDELASSMGAVIPIAANANFGIDELSASYATLTKNGIATSEAGTYMKSMLAELTKSGSSADKALHTLTGKGFAELKSEGKSTTDILQMLSDKAKDNGQSLKDMFSSTEAGSAALVLMSQDGSEYNDMLNAMGESAGATEDAFNKMADTPEEKMKALKNNFSNIGIEIGEVLLPIVMNVANWVSDHMPEIQAVVETVTTVIGTLIKGLSAIISALVKSAQTDGTYFNAVWTEIQVVFETVFKALQDIFAVFTAAFNGDWKTCWENVKKLFSDIWEGIKKLLKANLNISITIIKGFASVLLNAAKFLFNKILEGFKNVWGNIKTWVSTSMQNLVTVITNIGSKMYSAGKEIITKLWDGLKDVWGDIKNWVSNKVSWIADKVKFWKKSNDSMKTDGSHRTGLESVPFDGYIAELHRGEMVLTQPEADRYRDGDNTSTVTNNSTFNINVGSVRNDSDINKISRELQTVIKMNNRSLGVV
ncbi:MAG: phage tail tape measure protein [Clostridia bacterium]|nr:phage tail tape measure protein [Clostridia bacterium]MCI2014569.1 phage tail tape measure protein [Clostridia bacterium]